MAELIPSYKWTDFLKVAKLRQLSRLKSCEINFNGGYLFTFVNGAVDASGYLRKQTEYKCQTANAISGETLEDILGE